MIKETHRWPINLLLSNQAHTLDGAIDGVIFPWLRDTRAFLLLNHLVQFGINKHLWIFQRPQILLDFEKSSRSFWERHVYAGDLKMTTAKDNSLLDSEYRNDRIFSSLMRTSYLWNILWSTEALRASFTPMSRDPFMKNEQNMTPLMRRQTYRVIASNNNGLASIENFRAPLDD